jgi:hypothetical protein
MFARITGQEIRSKKFVVLALCLVAIHVCQIDTVGHSVAGMFQFVISA